MKEIPKMLKIVFFGIFLCSFVSYSDGAWSNLGDCVPPGKDVSVQYARSDTCFIYYVGRLGEQATAPK